MSLADETRREGATRAVTEGRYACRACGGPFGGDRERCPECGTARIAPIEEVIDPGFAN